MDNTEQKLKIGLALSGGGIRAAIFHLGVLKYLAEKDLFGQIASISSVSGGSLCVGAIFAANKNKWPSGKEFLDNVLPAVKKLILNSNLQEPTEFRLLLSLLLSPKYWRNRVGLLAKRLEEKWGITGSLQDLPQSPYWEINCTTFETGKSFRFRKDFMGDHKIGYVKEPNLPISHVIAASAGFPFLIGPYILGTKGMDWVESKRSNKKIPVNNETYSLWDGGVYDNLGLEALYKIGKDSNCGLDNEINFLAVSDASSSIDEKKFERKVSNLKRLLDITMSQINALRFRTFLASVIKYNKGEYLKIGNIADKDTCTLSPSELEYVKNYPTTLKAPSEKDFNLILAHGFENASTLGSKLGK